MKELKELLQKVGVKKALVVDDAFDATPLASDMAVDEEAWTRFFADLTEDDHNVLEHEYPGYEDTDANELRGRNSFVNAVWTARERLNKDAVGPLFARFERDREMDRAFTDALLKTLEAVGLEAEGCGREFVEKATQAQLIFVDLFLNTAQRDEDINLSIEGVRQVIERRRDDHPLVVLMSRSTRLPERRVEFQERTKLFETNFRIIAKSELEKPDVVARLLIRLSTHLEDSRRLLTFVNAWEDGILQARDKMMVLIRKIGLADIARIHQLLLSTEGEPAGSYLVDIFDKVLQHEIEGQEPIISAAKVMNELALDGYPLPFVPGEKDLQDFVQRCLLQNPARLGLAASIDSGVAFGDILRRKERRVAEKETDGRTDAPLGAVNHQMVVTVLTPACDLQRAGAKRVLLLVGTLKPLTAADWSYKDEGAKTPVVELGGGNRFWIKWDLKHIETLTHAQLETLLGADGNFEIVARLRESHALELQQKLLSNLGRIGLVAPMPATFNFQIEAFTPDVDGVLRRAEIATLGDGGVCFIGRDSTNKTEERLILTENACEAVWTYVSNIDPSTIHERARALVSDVRSTPDVLQALEQGLSLHSNTDLYKEMKSPSGKTVGLVKRSKIKDGEDKLSRKELCNAAIVLSVYTVEATVEDDIEERAGSGAQVKAEAEAEAEASVPAIAATVIDETVGENPTKVPANHLVVEGNSSLNQT